MNTHAPEAATDEPASSLNPMPAEAVPADRAGEQDSLASPGFATDAEDRAYWRGLNAGLIRAGRHGPARPDPDLTRDGSDRALASAALVDTYLPLATDARGRPIRHDGFTPAKQRRFLHTLAICGVVADACRAARVSRDTVYDFRNRAEGAAFARAWDAAILLSRSRLSDELESRALNGVVDRIYRNGELWGERHRHDNRLAMSVLTRLDRQAAGLGEGAVTARIIGQDWERFLDIVEEGGEGADTFLADRAPAARTEPAAAREVESAASLLARLKAQDLHDSGRGGEIRTDDLDPALMDGWTSEQWTRADLSGFLDGLADEEWPDEAREAAGDGTNGSCRTRRVYLERHPEETGDGGDDDFQIWLENGEDEGEARVLTNYPPPAGFDGFEDGAWGDIDYARALSPAEQKVAEADLARQQARRDAGRAETLAAARAARDRAFGFAGDSETRLPVEPCAQSDNSASEIREGDGE